jgi:hypothetical protein
LRKYLFTNYYDDTKKTITIALATDGNSVPDYVNNNSIQEADSIETKVLYNVI